MMIHQRGARAHTVRGLATTLLLSLVAGFLLAPNPVGPGPALGSEPSSELAVRLVDEADIAAVASDHGATGSRPMVATHGLWVLAFPDDDAREVAQDDLDDDHRVRWAEVEEAAELPAASHRSWAWLDDATSTVANHRSWAWLDGRAGEPSDAYLQQPAAVTLGLAEAHRTTRGAGTKVAIIDTGVDVRHPTLSGAVVEGGWDLIDDVAGADDAAPGAGRAAGHGTHVAGAIHLVAPDAGLLPFRVLDAEGVGSLAATILAIELAVDAGADVINLSLGTVAASEVFEDVIREAEDRGVVFVAAVGNRADDVEEYPARFNEVVAVGAVDGTDTAAPFSSDGDWVDVAAPGVELLGPYPDAGWASWSGTSMAAPLVTGQAALLRSLDRQRSAEDIVRLIDASAVEVSRRASAIGEGRIDVAASIALMLDR